MTKKKTNKIKIETFKWNVWTWSFNSDELKAYDVVPIFLFELKQLKKNEKPKTKDEFSEFIRREAQYHFWAKCEWEMIIHGWPVRKNDKKVDVYEQLMLNWNCFIDAFWNSYRSNMKSEHRKRRGGTAPNRALKK